MAGPQIPSKGHLPKARVQVLLLRANLLGFGAENLRKISGPIDGPARYSCVYADRLKLKVKARKDKVFDDPVLQEPATFAGSRVTVEVA